MKFQWIKKQVWINILGLSGIFIVPFLFAQANSIDRPYDVIQLKGSDLSAYVGQPIDEIHCYAYDATLGDWQPVPFQIDEKDTSGSYFPQKDGLLDTLDEVLFQSTDLGDKAPAGSWVDDQVSINSPRLEFRFDDPLSSGKSGWVYFFLSPSLDFSTQKYIDYDPITDHVSTNIYDIGHGDRGLINDISLKASAGGDAIDFFDRQKFMFKLKINILGSNQDMTIREDTDQDFELFGGLVKAHVKVSKIGVDATENPVIRLNRRVRLGISGSVLGENFDENMTFNMQYYKTHTSLGTGKMIIPELAYGSIKGNAELVIMPADLDVSATGMRFSNPYNPSGSIRVDSEPDNIDHTLNWPGNNWALFVANPDETHVWAELTHASLMHIISLTGNAPAPSASLYYDDNRYIASPNKTGDTFTFGDTGIFLEGDVPSGSQLSLAYTSYILPVNLTYTEGETLFNQHTHPLSRTITNQRYVHPVTIAVDPPGSGSFTLDPPAEQAYNGTVMTATAIESNPLYYFDRWTGDLTSSSMETTWTISGPVTLTAHFKPYTQIAFETIPEDRPYSINGTKYTSAQTLYKKPGEMLTVKMDSLQMVSHFERFRFLNWNSSIPSKFNYLISDMDTSFTANLLNEYLLRTAVGSGQAGSVIPYPSAWYQTDTEAEVQAVMTGTDLFLGWEGDLTGNENPATILMDEPKFVRALFGNLPPVVSQADTSFLEDTSLFLPLALLYEWIDDPNHADSLLAVQLSSGEHLAATWNETDSGYVIATSILNWFGQDSLILTATDPDGLIGQNKIYCTIMNDPDPPSDFSLLSPDSNFVPSEWPESIEFSWEIPADPDPDDAIVYHFEIDTTSAFNSPLRILIEDLSENEYQLNWPEHYTNGTYYWRVTAEDSFGETKLSSVFSFHSTTGISDSPLAMIPKTFVMDQNYPNPFNSRTIIRFGLPRSSQVRLTIFNQKGQEIREIIPGELSPGFHEIPWDGNGRNGLPVSTGVYLIVLDTGRERLTQKAIYLR